MTRVRGLLVCAVVSLALRTTGGLAASSSTSTAPSSYAPPGAFPTSLFEAYYNDPTSTKAQPQPVIYDPVLVRTHLTFCEVFSSLIHILQHKVFPPELTDPNSIPQVGHCLVQAEEDLLTRHSCSFATISQPLPPTHPSRTEQHPGSPPPPKARLGRISLKKCIGTIQLDPQQHSQERQVHGLHLHPSDRPVSLARRARARARILRIPLSAAQAPLYLRKGIQCDGVRLGPHASLRPGESARVRWSSAYLVSVARVGPSVSDVIFDLVAMPLAVPPSCSS